MQVPAVCTRSLEKDRMFKIASVNVGIGTLIRSQIPIHYVYGFSSDGFSYFMTTQIKYSTTNEPKEYITKLVRVCQNDLHYYSYTEIPVDCINAGQSIKYNLVQAAFLGKAGTDLAKKLEINTNDDVLYTAFSEGNENIPSNKSAICIYSLKSIRKMFMKNIQSCYNGHGSKGLEYFDHYYDNSNYSCIKSNLTIEEDFCGSKLNYPIGGEEAIIAVPMAIYQTRLTAIIAIQQGRFTVVYAGTADGHLKEISITSRKLVDADILIQKNSAINADLQIDQSEMDAMTKNLYVMTKNRLSKVKLYDCGDFSHCPKCSATKNPYCELCSFKNNCIQYYDVPSNINNFHVIGIVIGLIVLFVAVIFVIIIINAKREERLKEMWIAGNPEKINSDLTLIEQVGYLPYVKEYEYPEDKLKIGEEIGRGAFGVVYKSTATEILPDKSETIVAVKKNGEEVIKMFHLFKIYTNLMIEFLLFYME